MATPFPFPFLDDVLKKFGEGLKPPTWFVSEVQHRLVLLFNHVLMQEPQARTRLARQSGRVVEARWRAFGVRLVATPAGLLDVATPGGAPDLTLTLTEESGWELAQAALRGDKPSVQIAGDVQFAAEINWLVDNVRWDVEEDLSRLVGDAPAHTLASGARRVAEALRGFIRPADSGAPSSPPASPAASAASAPAAPAPAASTGAGVA